MARQIRRPVTRAAGKGSAARKTASRKATNRKTTSGRRSAQRGAAPGVTATGRSKKAGRPPVGSTARPQARRRQRSASTAVKKNGMRMQTDQGTKVLWGANQRRPTRV